MSMRKRALRMSLVLILAIGGAEPSLQAGSDWMGEANSGLNDYLELKRCMDQERASGSHKYTRCSAESQQRLDDTFERKESLRRKEEAERHELEEFTKGPNVFEEMQARYGPYFSFDECMSVYDERGLYGKRGFTRADARSECTKAVNQLRANCLNWRDEQCAEKGYLRPDQTAEALRQQQQDAQEYRQERERQRRQAKREEWIRAGGRPGECPSIQAAANRNHPCNY